MPTRYGLAVHDERSPLRAHVIDVHVDALDKVESLGSKFRGDAIERRIERFQPPERERLPVLEEQPVVQSESLHLLAVGHVVRDRGSLVDIPLDVVVTLTRSM